MAVAMTRYGLGRGGEEWGESAFLQQFVEGQDRITPNVSRTAGSSLGMAANFHATTPAPRVSSAEGQMESRGDLLQAKSSLSLLKSKIRRSSGGRRVASCSTNDIHATADSAHLAAAPTAEAPSQSQGLPRRRPLRANPVQDIDSGAEGLGDPTKARAGPSSRRAADKENRSNGHWSAESVGESDTHTAYSAHPSAGVEAPAYAPVSGEGVSEKHQCADCGRSFNTVPYQRHVKICAKVLQQKRKVFDASEMRTKDDPELARAAQQAQQAAEETDKNKKKTSRAGVEKKGAVGTPGKKDPKWRSQSNAFREAMSAARNIAEAIASGAPLPPPIASTPDPSLVPCPHCGRNFNEKAADRHIPQCQDIKAKPRSLKRGQGGGGGINGSAATAAAATATAGTRAGPAKKGARTRA
ncbi:hypothetical protein B484DRAFT_452891 [Ochromonadaceae sp. CCMP2298]|nr:hypothetical protein B484DRAFT_452891 [Ochromonadaceae sp. CCMP2298]